jgi:hypothetical protein
MSGASRVIAAFVWLGLSSAVACAQGYSAQNGQVHYDASKCSKDPRGMVYFAVGRRVFRQPMANIGYIAAGSRPANDAYPSPPDPSEPMGCPDHPLPGDSYTLSRMSAMPEDKLNANSGYADHISLVINDGATGAFTQDGLFDLLSKDWGISDGNVSGFIETAKRPSQSTYFAYKARDYLTPNGKKLTMTCHTNPPEEFITCEYGYMIGQDLAVATGFVTANVPLDKMIDADQELRRRIESAQVKDFRWADPKAGN